MDYLCYMMNLIKYGLKVIFQMGIEKAEEKSMIGMEN